MNAFTKFEPSMRAQVLICNARDEYGTRNPVSEGAVALAEFMAEHQDQERASGLILFLGGWTSVVRMLADDMMPGNDWGEEMGRVTDGAVTPNLWRRPFGSDIVRPDPLPAAAVEEPRPAPGGMLIELMGRQGEVASGPLFVAIRDPFSPNEFVVTGMGHATRYDLPMARALRAALADGLAQIGTGG